MSDPQSRAEAHAFPDRHRPARLFIGRDWPPPPSTSEARVPHAVTGRGRYQMGNGDSPRLTSASTALTALQVYIQSQPLSLSHPIRPPCPSSLPAPSARELLSVQQQLTSSVLRAPTLRMCTSPTTTKLTPQPTPPPPSLRAPSSPPSPSASRTWAPRSTSRPSRARTSSSLSRAREYCCLRDSARRPVLADRHRSHRCWSG